MKGVIFTDCLRLVEDRFGLETVDSILNESQLDSGGAYTSLGTYSHRELLTLVDALSAKTRIEPDVLINTFGHHLIDHFTQRYPSFVETEADIICLHEMDRAYIPDTPILPAKCCQGFTRWLKECRRDFAIM